MDINDVNPWEVLGLQEPETAPAEQGPAGENEPETAEPAGAGGNEPGPAEPDTDEDMDPEPRPDAEPEEEPEEQPAKNVQTREERAANAKRRRQAEIDKAVQEALEAEREAQKRRLDAFFAQAKMKNAHNGGSDILSLEDAESWAQQDRLARATDALKKGKLTAEDLQALVEESPAFKAMQQKQARQEQAMIEQDKQRYRQAVDTELAEIRKLNPKINGLQDILAMETGKQWAAYVKNNKMSYLDAYKLANHDSLMQQAQQTAANGARAASAGKDHLTKTKPRGTGTVAVPADVRESYRALMPNMTDEEIQREYTRFLKNK